MTQPTVQVVQQIWEENGELCVYDRNSLPFVPRRAFTVRARAGQIRGQHAHKTCSQFLVALQGRIRVKTEGRAGKAEYDLDSSHAGLYLPAMHWSEQIYENNENLLLVLCDQEYDETEYIRDYEDFLLRIRAASSTSA